MNQQPSMMNGASCLSGIPYAGMLSFARIAHAAMPDTSRAIPVPGIAIAETQENLYTPYTPEYDGYLSVLGLSGPSPDEGVISISKGLSIADNDIIQNVRACATVRRGLFVPLLAGVAYHIRTHNIKSISAQFFPLAAYAMDGRWVTGV